MSTQRPSIDVAVVMRKERVLGAASRWQTWRWVLGEVLTGDLAQGTLAKKLYENEDGTSWLHPGFKVELFKDDGEGYYLNLSTPQPAWFVMWRMQESALWEEAMPIPQLVSLSYHDAGRLLDAQETVEQVSAPADIVDWLRTFVEEHHVLEEKRRRRPQSFMRLTDRFGSPASVSTGKPHGGGGNSGGNSSGGAVL